MTLLYIYHLSLTLHKLHLVLLTNKELQENTVAFFKPYYVMEVPYFEQDAKYVMASFINMGRDLQLSLLHWSFGQIISTYEGEQKNDLFSLTVVCLTQDTGLCMVWHAMSGPVKIQLAIFSYVYKIKILHMT